ncbi:cationic amino acid transporter 2-like isoform X2 [Planococcus citri]|uniref:cationic amino acid transporter 2-like isoform X2 n=1 Tax=Planococcus citri TaxID=170843 RepID=UPI0031F8ECBF
MGKTKVIYNEVTRWLFKIYQIRGVSSAFTRRKTDIPGEVTDSKLARVLGLVDLTSLGVGSTLGLGVYVLAGAVALNEAGPAVSISFLIAAIASAFAGLCYAEFASRVPRAGSAYVYCYVTVGEFTAFVIGWNLVLEYAIGTAAVAKGLSNYVDALSGKAMENALKDWLPMHIPFLAPYPDFFACSIVLVLTLLLARGVKESSSVNNAFTVVNLITVVIVIVAGAYKANPSYWSIPKEEIPPGVRGGEGGYIPFGWSGVLAGAAKCFFGYIGFDVIATTGDEAKNPKRNIPLAIILSLLIIFMAYFGVATVLTMLLPYYKQDANAPLPLAFSEVQMPALMYIISIGAICALCASLLGAIFPLPRILFAMADDGLLFSCFAEVNKFTKTPVKATLISGVLAGCVSCVFDLTQLIDMMSIGTLLAYTIVALCILILRYREDAEGYKQSSSLFQNTNPESKSSINNIWNTFKVAFNLNKSKYPTTCSQKMALWSLFTFVISVALLCFFFIYGSRIIRNENIFLYILLVFLVVCILSFVILSRQPQASLSLPFQVPLVPLVPFCSISMNIYLMLKLDIHTWVRFIFWLAIGFVIYFTYSIKHSIEGKKHKALQQHRAELNKNNEIDLKT